MSRHIAIVVPYSLDVPGGVGQHALGEARWLRGRGHQVTLIAPGTHPVSGLEGVRLVSLGRARGFAFNGSVAHLAISPSQSRMAVAAVADAEVVHVHEPLTPGIAFAAARAADQLLVTHHASFTPSRALELILYRRARALGPYSAVAVSEAARSTAAAVTEREDIEVLPNAIDIPAPSWPARTEGALPRVVFLGRAGDPRKGFDHFVALAARLGDGVEFVALGPGTETESGPVRGLGLVDEAQRAATLAEADVLVAPNLKGESFGLVLVEALAAGARVAASDLPGFRETLHDAVTADLARLFPTGDLAAAESAVRQLLLLPPNRAAAHRYAQRWGWDRVGPALERHLEQLTAR